MSSFSINGLGQGLNQLFGSFSGASPTPSTSSTGSTTAASSTSPAGAATPAAPPTQQVSGHHHRHGHGGGKQFQQIQDAVTTALQSAGSSGSNSDPNKVIEDAIAKVFKQAGTGASSTSPSTSAAGPQQPTGSDSDGDGNVDASGQADNSSQQAFFKTLQSLGVSPQQFRNDFLAAVKDAQQSGNVDVSTALKSLPIGSTLDAIG